MELKEVEEILAKQRAFIYNCENTFDDIKCLQATDTLRKSESELLEDFDSLWHRISGLLWSHLVLDLNKLYTKGKNDKFQFYKLLHFLKTNYSHLPIKNAIKIGCIDTLIEIMDSEEFLNHYKKIKKIRNEYIAHLDKKSNELRIENEDINYFLELNQQILEKLIDPITIGGPSGYFRYSHLQNFISKMASYKGVYDKIELGVRPGNITPETEKELLRILDKRSFIKEGIG